MALKKTVPAPTGQALSSVDERLNQAGQLVRNTAGAPRGGVLPHTTTQFVSARATMGVDVGIFYAALVRGGGALFIMNDGTVVVPIGSAPASNSQYKIIYVKQNETESPFADANNLPVLDYVQGNPTATPDATALAAAIALVPAGGLPLYSVLVPSTATTTQSAGVVISPIFPMTSLAGGEVWIRSQTERAGFTATRGQKILRLDKDWIELFDGSDWRIWQTIKPIAFTPSVGGISAGTTSFTFSVASGVVSVAGRFTLAGSAVTGALSFSLPTEFTFAGAGNRYGDGYILAAGLLYDVIVRQATSTAVAVEVVTVNGTYATLTPISPTIPYSWANGASIDVNYSFIPA